MHRKHLAMVCETSNASIAAKLCDMAPRIIEDILLHSRQYVSYTDSAGMVRWKIPTATRLVCRRWNSLVIEDARMWRHIYVTETSREGIEIHLERSRALPLMVWLKTGALDNIAAHDLLAKHRHRWEGLFFENRTLSSAEPMGMVIALYKLDVGRWAGSMLELLRYLHIGGNSVGLSDDRMTTLELPSLELLSISSTIPNVKISGAVGLKSLQFKDCFFMHIRFSDYLATFSDTLRTLHVENVVLSPIQWPTSLVFTTLQRIIIQSQAYAGFTRAFFTHARLPRLRSLAFCVPNDQTVGVVTVPMDFPLLIKLDVSGRELPGAILAEILAASPVLTELVLPWTNRQGVFASILDVVKQHIAAMGENCSIKHISGEHLQLGEARKLVEAMTNVKRVSVRQRAQEAKKDALEEDSRWFDDRDVELHWV